MHNDLEWWRGKWCAFRDDMILRRSGKDAVQYLKFQRYLMVYVAVITILSIGVILPINFQGDLGRLPACFHFQLRNMPCSMTYLQILACIIGMVVTT